MLDLLDISSFQIGIVVLLSAIYRIEREETRAVERALTLNRALRRAYLRGHGDGYDLGFVRGFEAGGIAARAHEVSQ